MSYSCYLLSFKWLVLFRTQGTFGHRWSHRPSSRSFDDSILPKQSNPRIIHSQNSPHHVVGVLAEDGRGTRCNRPCLAKPDSRSCWICVRILDDDKQVKYIILKNYITFYIPCEYRI